MQSVSKFLLLSGIFLTIAVFPNTFAQNPFKNTQFVSPLDIPLYLSSNYGEYRSGRFHAGVDFKTQGEENKNVYAADSGYIYRIVVMAASYGNALYIKHPSGFITLYGHLNRFEPSVERYVKEQQYKKKSFTVDLYPEPERFVLRKKQFIGLSGNTGMSFGAHLHFEIRDRSGAIPLNPLQYGFDVKDRTRPEIRWLMVSPLDTGSVVNGSREKLTLQCINSGRKNGVNPDTIDVWGNIGLGIETYDFLDNSSNQCGPAYVELTVDGKPIVVCLIDSISFNSGSYFYSFYDYGEMQKSGRKIQKLYIDPNNKLSIYKLALNRGILSMNDSRSHPVKILVKDTHGNESMLEFTLRSIKAGNLPRAIPDSFVVNRFYYDSLNIYENQNVRIAVPNDALFDHIDFRYFEEKNDSFRYSLVHKVHDRFTPLLRPYVLSIRSNEIPDSLRHKSLIASRGGNGSLISQGGEYANGYVTTEVRTFGTFIITVDSVAPEIRPVNFTSAGRYGPGQKLSFTIKDTLSGINKYTGLIDGKWALFEYDLKNDLLSYRIDSDRLTRGKQHDLVIIVTDNKGNTGRFKSSFFY